jgi:molybdenum cofactor cytidylyltransferase
MHLAEIGGLILASATGQGLGGALALAPWEETTLVEHVTSVARSAGLDPIVVVVGPRSDDLVDAVDLGKATFVIDPAWGEGRAAALRSGLDTMSRFPDVETVVIIELDRPTVTADVIAAVAAGPRSSPAPVTVPKYRYVRGGPVAVDRSLWPRLMGLEGDVYLMDLVEAHPAWINEVRIDRLPPERVETPDDLAVALGRH